MGIVKNHIGAVQLNYTSLSADVLFQSRELNLNLFHLKN